MILPHAESDFDARAFLAANSISRWKPRTSWQMTR